METEELKKQYSQTDQRQYNLEILNALIKALKELGGSAAKPEVVAKTAELLHLTQEETERKKRPEDYSTIFATKLNWTRWALSLYGLIENPNRGVWQLTEAGWQVTTITEEDRIKILQNRDEYMNKYKIDKARNKQNKESDHDPEEPPADQWKKEIIDQLQKLDPYKFELLCKNILSKMGFVNVQVTQSSNDGGIDGHGILKINDVIGFKVAFQCKRYVGSVGAPEVQKFRGASTQFEKSMLITTGTFTREAKKNAEIAPRIEMIDGDLLAETMAKLGLGVKKDQIVVDESYFSQFR